MRTLATFTVLVINDNEAHCTGLAELLELRGFKALTALTGTQGLKLAFEVLPDAVLLDMNLPDIDGTRVFETMRSDDTLRTTSIIFHSGQPAPSSAYQGDAFLTYPVSTDTLVAVIVGCIRKRRTSKSS